MPVASFRMPRSSVFSTTGVLEAQADILLPFAKWQMVQVGAPY